MDKSNARIVNYKEFINESKRPDPEGAIWRWADIERELEKAFETDPISPGRAAVSLVHGATGEALGVSSGINVLIQELRPGSSGTPHRHSNFAIFIVRQGVGYTIIDGAEIKWASGDVFFAPPWVQHQHFNSSETEPAVLYTVQNVPEVVGLGTWFFQGADGNGFKRNIKDD